MDVREKAANEKRLIDREALLSFEKMDAELCATCGEHHTAEDVIMMIKTAPTVDAVPVVRCWECKHLNVVNRKELYAHCPKTNTVFLPLELDTREHFCSLGERKEGADNDT